MVDLQGQYKRIKSEIDNAIHTVVDSAAFINGPVVDEFQANLEKYLGIKHVIPCANGTDALQISMMALGLKPGDEIITTSFTFIATVEVIALLKLIPVLVDIEPDTFNINPDEIKKAITSKTKAIIPVHLFGQCANMEAIMDIAQNFNLKIIEDNCQAIGAEYIFKDGRKKKSGGIGDIGCTSFFPSKNLGAYGDGGAIFTNDDKLAKQCRVIANHGMTVRYYHDLVGVNSRLDSIQAALLNVKLKYLDEYIDARNKVAEYYSRIFQNHPNLITPVRFKHSTHVFHQYTLRTKNIERDRLKEYVQSKGIPTAIYYPIPIHMQKAYRNSMYKKGNLPISEMLSKSVISLPMHTELDVEQLDYITNAVLEFCK